MTSYPLFSFKTVRDLATLVKMSNKKLKLFQMKGLIKALKLTNTKARTFIVYYCYVASQKHKLNVREELIFQSWDQQLLNFFDIKYSIKVIGNPQKFLKFHSDFFFCLFCFPPFFLSSKWETPHPTNHERSIQVLFLCPSSRAHRRNNLNFTCRMAECC